MDLAEPLADWKGTTAVIIAGGPSLTVDDVSVAEAAAIGSPQTAHLIAVNEAWRLIKPYRGSVVYGADPIWWKQRGPTDPVFDRWTQDKNWKTGEADALGVRQIRSEGGAGISTDPSFIYQGANSSFQAMNLAVLFGARRIVFLGLDLSAGADGETHWHKYPSEFERRSPGWDLFKSAFETAAPILQGMGVEVINASRRTVLECFPRIPINEALK